MRGKKTTSMTTSLTSRFRVSVLNLNEMWNLKMAKKHDDGALQWQSDNNLLFTTKPTEEFALRVWNKSWFASDFSPEMRAESVFVVLNGP